MTLTPDPWQAEAVLAGRQRALAREWDEVMREVRSLDGFADFMGPPRSEDLLAAAGAVPVVVLNVNNARSDALIVVHGDTELVELPELRAGDVATRTAAYLDALRAVRPQHGIGFAEGIRRRRSSMDQLRSTLGVTTAWLWDAVAEPVLDALGHVRPPGKGQLWPRVCWCPTGLLCLLPVHGAGHHGAGDGRAVVDRVVSSYTPTLRALEAGGPRHSGRNDPPEPLLFVGAPDVPGELSLADVERERDLLASTFPGGIVDLGAPVTVEQVREALTRHRLVHVSCHGRQDLDDPSAAGFVLPDGVLTVLRLSAARHGGDFAFLSACRTATGGVRLPDEVITLASALSHTGFRHVVGTLWSVDPRIVADVAEVVYPTMTEGGRFDPELSAVALHRAVQSLRERAFPLDDWLPFVHTGP